MRPAAATATAISRHLANNGIHRTKGLQGGFRVSRTDTDGRILVEYVLGYTATSLGHDRRREIMAAQMRRMERLLTRRYTVTTHTPDTGWHGFYLLVGKTPGDDLTPRMRTAYQKIKEGGITYHYSPLTPSLTRAKPITTADLTPAFSGGLLTVSVMALERRGLVRLVPVTPDHGHVIATPEDTDA